MSDYAKFAVVVVNGVNDERMEFQLRYKMPSSGDPRELQKDPKFTSMVQAMLNITVYPMDEGWEFRDGE